MSKAPERIWAVDGQTPYYYEKEEHRPEEAVEYVRADLYNQQAAEIERLRAAQEWQPIETAPRVDDFTCLVAGRSRSGDWFMDVACWQADDEGWWPNTLNSVGYQLNFSFWTPEVWMPLPEPPSAALGEKGDDNENR